MAPPTPAAPPNWPPAVRYLSVPVPSPRLPAVHKAVYCAPCAPQNLPNAPPKLSVKRIGDPSHPAYGQCGLFNASNKPIERGTWLRDYIGIVHGENETDPTSDYDLSLLRTVETDEEGNEKIEVVGIDATKAGNEARFVNDYRGTGLPRPNAAFELRRFPLPPSSSPSAPKEGIRMAVFAGPHGIDKNAEICVSYGRGFWEKRREEAERKAAEEAEKEAKEEPGKGKKGGKKGRTG
ncbi:hypothetical protein JCM10213_005825 [Rhodosporidiobolus nylandii]